MNASPRNKTTGHFACLTLEQLKGYQNHTLSPKEQHAVEDHLLDCELCSDALAGFAIVPISFSDVEQINKNIDKLSGKAYVPTVESKMFFALVSVTTVVISSIAIYLSINFNTTINPSHVDAPKVTAELFASGTPPENTIKIEGDEVKNDIALAPITNNVKQEVKLNFPKEAFTSEFIYLPQKDIDFVSLDINKDAEKLKVPILILGNDTFIYDLKITDYNKFYFVNTSNIKSINSGTNAIFENKDEVSNGVYKLQEWEVTTTAQVLRAALNKFSKQEYANAQKLFDILIKHNADDVNALFYGALCAYNMNNNSKAIDYLDKVMANLNGSFYEEAKWYKALSLLNTQPKDAKLLLEEIALSNGFYAKKAKDKLKTL